MTACVFCDIVSKKVPAHITYEDEAVLAFSDLHPQAPVHELIIPKKHFESIVEMVPGEQALLGHLVEVAKGLAEKKGLQGKGFRLVTNVGTEAGQSVFHLHFHLLGGRPMKWPPG